MLATITASGEVELSGDELLLAAAAEETGEGETAEEVNNPILPAPAELVPAVVAFVLLFLVLAKFGLPAVKGAMDAREEHIRSSIAEAERTRDEASAVLADYQRQLADAKGEAARIIEEARQTADALKRDLTAKAEAEAAELRARNAEQVAAERDRVMAELQGQVAALAIELAEKVVERNLDRETNTALIESYINSVEATGGAARA